MTLELTTPCIPTVLSLTANGYGQIRIRGQYLLAHRLAYELAHGSPPPGAVVRHLCGNRACINPAHLTTGSHQDNADDREAHGRTARGERHGCAKLTLSQVENIRLRLAAGEKGRTIAKSLGISESLVSLIKRNKIWSTQ